MSTLYILYPQNSGGVSSGSSQGGLSSVSFSVGVLDGLPPNPNGASVSSNSLFMQSFTASFPGLVNSASQTFGGVKTFSSPLTMTAIGTVTLSAGQMIFDNQSQGITFQNTVSSISLQVGQENWVQVQNNSGATIGNGRAVYITGSVQGSDIPTVGLAIATTTSTSALLGVSTHDIANGSVGYVTQSGKVHGIDTSAYSGGQRVWLSTASAGFFQVSDPSPPNFNIFVGYVLDVGSTTGSLFLSGIRTSTQVPFVSPITTSGDLIVGSGTGTAIATRIGIGASPGNKFLTVSTGSLIQSWQQVSLLNTIGSISLVNQVVGNLPLSQTSGSLSLTNQVVGSLPLTQTSGSISLTNQVMGSLPLSQTSGSISLVNQVFGNLPLSQTSGSVSFSQLTPVPQFTIGSVTLNSSTSGSAYTLTLPGTIGSGTTYLSNNGLGATSWLALTSPSRQTFQTSGSFTYTLPTGVKFIKITVVGAGGGGGGAATAAASSGAAGGGGGGGAGIKWISSPNASYTLSVGAGGAGGPAGNNTGGTGANTWFSHNTGSMTALGGTGGSGSAATAGFPVFTTGIQGGGSSTNGDINLQGFPGSQGIALSLGQVLAGSGGGSALGTGAGGIAGQGTQAGGAGAGFGGGGSGGAQTNNGTAQAGGAGAGGLVIVEEWVQ